MLSRPQESRGSAQCPYRCNQQTLQDGRQIETTIETILGLGKIAMRVFGKVEGMIGARVGGLQIAQKGIDGAELLQLGAAGAAAGHGALVRRSCGGSKHAKLCPERTQTSEALLPMSLRANRFRERSFSVNQVKRLQDRYFAAIADCDQQICAQRGRPYRHVVPFVSALYNRHSTRLAKTQGHHIITATAHKPAHPTSKRPTKATVS